MAPVSGSAATALVANVVAGVLSFFRGRINPGVRRRKKVGVGVRAVLFSPSFCIVYVRIYS
jgi:hypothetical protein